MVNLNKISERYLRFLFEKSRALIKFKPIFENCLRIAYRIQNLQSKRYFFYYYLLKFTSFDFNPFGTYIRIFDYVKL
jgi:hypothetical protein